MLSCSSDLPEGIERAVLERLLLGLAPSEVYLADQVALIAGGLLHHRFTLTLSGGLLSVALSLGLPRVGVTHHFALWSPDVPRQCRDRLADPSL